MFPLTVKTLKLCAHRVFDYWANALHSKLDYSAVFGLVKKAQPERQSKAKLRGIV